MSKRSRAAKAQPGKKVQPRSAQPVVEARADDLVGLAQQAGGLIATAAVGTLQAQAARLGDARLQTVQRQTLAAQIGRVQGNQHLQRGVASLKHNERAVLYQPKDGKGYKQPRVASRPIQASTAPADVLQGAIPQRDAAAAPPKRELSLGEAESLTDLCDPKKKETPKSVYANTKELVKATKEIWRFIGIKRVLLKGEARVGNYSSLGVAEGLQRHHIPQNALMKRIRAWVAAYIGRAADENELKCWRNRLAGYGVKWTALQGYDKAKGICCVMERTRHTRTRTYGRVRQGLLIPQGKKADVEDKYATKKRTEEFVQAVKEEFAEDKKDVAAIYQGKKGLPEVTPPKLKTVRDGLAQVEKANVETWGRFLATG